MPLERPPTKGAPAGRPNDSRPALLDNNHFAERLPSPGDSGRGAAGSSHATTAHRPRRAAWPSRHPFMPRAQNVPVDELNGILEEAASLAEEGKLDEAIGSYDMALELEPECLLACAGKAEALMNKGMHREAAHLFEGFEIREDDPPSSLALLKKSMALYNLGRPEECLACLDMIKASDPNYADARFNKAVVLGEWNEARKADAGLEEALSCYDEAILAKPDFPDALYNRGLLLQKLRRPEDAIESFGRAIELAPDFAAAHDAKATALNFIGRYGEELPCHREAIRLRPDFAEALYNMANTLYYLGQIEESKRLLVKATRLNPELQDHVGIASMLDDRLAFNRKIRGGA